MTGVERPTRIVVRKYRNAMLVGESETPVPPYDPAQYGGRSEEEMREIEARSYCPHNHLLKHFFGAEPGDPCWRPLIPGETDWRDEP